MAMKLYTKQFAGLLPNIFEKKTYFLRAFGNKVQVVDGVKESDAFLELKTSDEEVVIQDYSVEPDVAFGTGTGNSNRFGPRKEIKSVNTQVPYEAPQAIHEGIDDMTVNDIKDQVIAERLALHGEAWAESLTQLLGLTLSEMASETLTGALDIEGITALFNEAHKKFVNNKVSKTIAHVAYVNADVYSLIVDHLLTTNAKNSTVNIDNQEVYKFKGFLIEEVPDDYFQEGEQVIFSADNVGLVGLGVSVARAMDSEEFAGVALQGAGKYGKYVPEKNKKAVLKATLTPSV